jgi:hypothetical protein
LPALSYFVRIRPDFSNVFHCIAPAVNVEDVPLIADILGHYHIMGELGKIGTGEVCRSMNQKLRRDIAIKLLSKEAEKDPDPLWPGLQFSA